MAKDEGMIEAVKSESEVFAAFTNIAESEHGLKLIESVAKSVAVDIDFLVNRYQTSPEIELRAKLATLAAHLSILKALSNARQNFDSSQAYLKELLEA